mgnify:CR=1 FL=1
MKDLYEMSKEELIERVKELEKQRDRLIKELKRADEYSEKLEWELFLHIWKKK